MSGSGGYGDPYGHGGPPAPPPAPPPGWGRAAPPSHAHAGPEPYHRILRTPSYHPWRPIVGILFVVSTGVLVGPLLVSGAVGAGLAVFSPDHAGSFFNDLLSSTITPSSLLAINLSLAALIPITWMAIRFFHGMRPRWLSSVRPGLRWRLLLQFIGLAVVALVLFAVGSSLILGSDTVPVDTDDSQSVSTTTTIAFLVVIVLTQPLQSAAEEYAFRGYLLQAFGALVRVRWFTLVLTSLLFALAHGSQNLPLFTDRFLFGLVAGALVMVTGGLEAGIALHIVNNVFVLLLAAAAGGINDTLNLSEAGWDTLISDIANLLVFAALVLWWSRRKALTNVTAGPPDG